MMKYAIQGSKVDSRLGIGINYELSIIEEFEGLEAEALDRAVELSNNGFFVTGVFDENDNRVKDSFIGAGGA